MIVKNMKLSELSDDKINSLSNSDKEKIVYIDKDGGFTADVGIILGGSEEVILARAEAGLKAYKEGRVKYLVPTGHPDLTCNGETLPEYMHIKKISFVKWRAGKRYHRRARGAYHAGKYDLCRVKNTAGY